MTYGEAKNKVIQALFHLKPATDVEARLPFFFSMAQKEIADIAPIERRQCGIKATFEPVYLDGDITEVHNFLVDGKAVPFSYSDNTVTCWKSGAYTVEYGVFPEDITEDTEDSHELELSTMAQQALIWNVCAMCVSDEYDQRYFNDFQARYQSCMNNIVSRQHSYIGFTGGVAGL